MRGRARPVRGCPGQLGPHPAGFTVVTASGDIRIRQWQLHQRPRRGGERYRLRGARIGHAGPDLPALRRLLLVILGQQGRLSEARRLIESLWSDTAIVPTADQADRLTMVREYVGLDLEPFPLESNLSRLEDTKAATGELDQRAIALARAYLATRSGDFERARAEIEACLNRRPDDPVVWKARLDWSVAAGRLELARAAVDHIAADTLEPAQIGELRAWFARQRRDDQAERRALEQLVKRNPGQIAAVARLAEAPPPSRPCGKRQRHCGIVKTSLDEALDRAAALP